MKINAVFEGGGVKAIGLVGAVQAAEEAGFAFRRMAGTSSGALVASLLAAGYNAQEMAKLIQETPFTEFLPQTALMRIKWVGPPLQLLLHKGLYPGDKLEQWIGATLAAKGVRTFADIGDNKLRVVVSDITDGRLVVLPDDLHLYGFDPATFAVSRAVRMSTSIPYFFEPVIIRRKKQTPIYMVDGALLSNFPMWLFDSEPAALTPTIGFQLVGKRANKPRTIIGPFSMFYALFSTMLEAHDERFIEEHHRFRTVKIDTLDVSATQFDLSDADSARLYASGLAAGRKFFDRWSVSAYQKNYDLLCAGKHEQHKQQLKEKASP